MPIQTLHNRPNTKYLYMKATCLKRFSVVKARNDGKINVDRDGGINEQDVQGDHVKHKRS